MKSPVPISLATIYLISHRQSVVKSMRSLFKWPSVRVNLLFVFGLLAIESQAADQFFAGDGSALTASKWAATSAGPFSSAFTSGNVANFAVVNGTGAGAGGITVSGLNATENFTYNSGSSGTLLTGGAVIPVTVSSGKTLNIDSSLSISGAAGVGFIKNGPGALAWSGGSYPGGFTLNTGTLVSRGVNAMGAGGALTINGGTIAGSATRDFAGKYTSVTIGGDFQLGALASAVPLSADVANLNFNNNMALGASTRTITIGGNGTYILGGVISGGAGVGLTVNALSGVTGTLTITNANTYSGNTTISGGILSIAETGGLLGVAAKLGNEAGTLVLNGGTLFRASQNTVETHLNPISLTDNSTVSGNSGSTRSLTFNTASITLTAGKTLTIRSLAVGGVFDFRLTGGGFNWSEPIIIGQTGEGIAFLGPRNDNTVADQTYSGVISGPGRISRNVSSSNPGGNSLISNPNNSYTGGTEVRGGFIGLGADNPLGIGKITIGADPNPLGLYASGAARLLTNSITADIAIGNSTNFQVRGSQDLTLSGGFVITNTMFLTISNTALTTLSGVVTNAATAGGIVKLGFGKLVFSGSNVYSGTTVVLAGSLLANNTAGSGTSTGSVVVASSATLGGTGIILGAVTNSGGTIQPGLGGTNTATLTISNNLSLTGNTLFNLNRTNAQNASKISGLATVTYGGTLTVTNLGPDLLAGDTFTLFSATAYAGNFSSVVLPALNPGLGWSTNNLFVNGSVLVTNTPTALALASSSNPSGYLGTLTFTATVTPASAPGSVVFYAGAVPFSTNTLSSGTAVSSAISSLPRGTNLITAISGGSGGFLPSTNSLNQIVTNHPPVALNLVATRATGATTWKISVTDLLTNVTDVDADTFSLTSVTISTNGATPFIAGGYVLYTNTNLVADQFTYNVTDSFGGTASALVKLGIGGGGASGQAQSVVISGSTATLNFAGIPGFSYDVQRSTNLTDWTTILTTNPVAGVFQCTDNFNDLGGALPASAYYRLSWNP